LSHPLRSTRENAGRTRTYREAAHSGRRLERAAVDAAFGLAGRSVKAPNSVRVLSAVESLRVCGPGFKCCKLAARLKIRHLSAGRQPRQEQRFVFPAPARLEPGRRRTPVLQPRRMNILTIRDHPSVPLPPPRRLPHVCWRCMGSRARRGTATQPRWKSLVPIPRPR
jgi:hypothetical protein